MILPLVIAVVLISGVFASLESRTALTRVAIRHLAFKAELLRDYFYSEWDVITQLNLDNQSGYFDAAKESFRTYAYSLLRNKTELIVVFDFQGNLVMRVGFQEVINGNLAGETVNNVTDLPDGWFTVKLFGESRAGTLFTLEPVRWRVAVTELESTYFSDVWNIQITHTVILLITIVVAIIFLSIFISHITRPMERLTETIIRITATNDLTERVKIEFADEIGTLAHQFNIMLSALQSNYREMEETSRAEKQARLLAIEREETTLYLLARVAEFRDAETGNHLKRIASLSTLFSKLLGQSEEEQKLMWYSAPLHDIGKIGIPDSILLKPGMLTEEESGKMKEHTVLGNKLLSRARSKYLIEGAEIALTHHEKWDGSGYPQGLAGEEIPLSGRIVSIVDVFDALTSIRPYKEKWNHERATDFIIEQRGRHFDPRLVDLFLENISAFRECLHSIESESESEF
ncbi:MAG: HD domain-containing protein [Spirochaetales bacterium]|nr:HD domain-containing protein [Spirochaetales bacterium]